MFLLPRPSWVRLGARASLRMGAVRCTSVVAQPPPLPQAAVLDLIHRKPEQAPLLPCAALAVQRDDRLPLEGNKSRKAAFLLRDDILPRLGISQEALANPIIVSHGGAQSNAMLALAQVCADRGWRFVYATRLPNPALAHRDPNDNLQRSLDLGMEVLPVEKTADLAATAQAYCEQQPPGHAALIPQGLALPQAGIGCMELIQQLEGSLGRHDPWCLILPSGTGTTALYCHLATRARGLPWHVITVPVANPAPILARDMALAYKTFRHDMTPPADLNPSTIPTNCGASSLWADWPDLRTLAKADLAIDCIMDTPKALATVHPIFSPPPGQGRLLVLNPPPHLPQAFAAPDHQYLEAHHAAQAAWGINFDLVYFPRTLLTLQYYANPLQLDNQKLCFIHTGGTSGNASMRARIKAT
ncbi:uncharacterized protein MONBRDRAFT_11070 [Monosiga brevicollis MX1]|uniref:Tryptophan synthase beta chain-like PALP domain-containing protein n=1 Tax=Monosiga brevicollis TaxID=81824 RepID=A9V844_MONBE|nr:uncharacterized protein MONBRDRAFT_11070 [Monosiga brevicollis MX1]EDQ86274.1 predicted protein [Monosiga brevicollis MX1]|eukprot:XP_001748944.1 hypothetical protein [Monosiga brevicollis MX1]